jgi:hypothetical protein
VRILIKFKKMYESDVSILCYVYFILLEMMIAIYLMDFMDVHWDKVHTEIYVTRKSKVSVMPQRSTSLPSLFPF